MVFGNPDPELDFLNDDLPGHCPHRDTPKRHDGTCPECESSERKRRESSLEEANAALRAEIAGLRAALTRKSDWAGHLERLLDRERARFIAALETARRELAELKREAP